MGQSSGGVDRYIPAVSVNVEQVERQSKPTRVNGSVPGRSRWVDSIRVGLGVWVATRLAYLAVTILSPWVGGGYIRFSDQMAVGWRSWDAGHFLRIAEHGYGVEPLDLAFFPVYPMLMRALNWVLPGNALAAGLFVSSLASLGLLILLHRLVTTEFSATMASRTLYALAAFPTAFFLAGVYNESLFLLLAVGSLYLARGGNWWAAGAVAAVASGTRSAGLLLLLPLAYEYLRQTGFPRWRPRWDVLSLALVPVGLMAYMAYCWVQFDDAMAFSNAQEYWYRSFSIPPESIWRTFSEAADDHNRVINVIDGGSATLALIAVVLCFVGPWRLPRDTWYLAIFGAAMLALPLCYPAGDDRPLISMARHALEVLPIFLIAARMATRESLRSAYLAVGVSVQVCFLLIYLRYGWIA